MPIPSDTLAAHLKEFVARAGHDLCGPLNQANSLASLFVKRYRGRLDADADIVLDHLASSARRMEYLADGLYKYFEAAAPLPPLDPADLNQVLSAALVALRGPIEKTRAVITSDRLPEREVAPSRIQMLFEALLGNAIQFSKPDAVPRISIAASAAGDFRRFSVCDEGIGMEPEDYETAFLPFRRLYGRAWPGPGLGLATARLIVESHGGTIHIEAGESGGICLVFTL